MFSFANITRFLLLVENISEILISQLEFAFAGHVKYANNYNLMQKVRSD